MKKLLLFVALFISGLATVSAQELLISEILYARPGGGGGAAATDSLDFVEIFNAGSSPVNLEGFTLRNFVSDTFPNAILQPGAYYVSAWKAGVFQKKFGKAADSQLKKGRLTAGGGRIELFSSQNILLDSVRYRAITPWPIIAANARASIVVCDLAANNGVGASWFASTKDSGYKITAGGGGGGGATQTTVFASPGAVDCPVIAITATNPSLTTNKNTNLPIVLNTLATPATAVITITKQPLHGTLTPAIGGGGGGGGITLGYTYAPKAGYCGNDAIEYKATIGSNVANGTINIFVNCNINYKKYTIGDVTKDSNNDFRPDSLNQVVELQGIVHSPNFATNPAVQFCIIDAGNKTDGIIVNNATFNYGYTPKEGDIVVVQGKIGQAQGVTLINPDSIYIKGTDAKLFDPTVVTVLDESTEAALVKLKGLTLVTPAQWGTTGGGGGGGGGAAVGYTLDVTDGVNKYVIFVDKDIEDLFFSVGPKTKKFDCVGIGSQLFQGGGGGGAQTANTGYRLMPRHLSDLSIITATNDLELGAALSVYPNPFNTSFVVNTTEQMERMNITDVSGKTIFSTTEVANNQTVNTESWAKGVYFITVEKEGRQFTTKLIK